MWTRPNMHVSSYRSTDGHVCGVQHSSLERSLGARVRRNCAPVDRRRCRPSTCASSRAALTSCWYVVVNVFCASSCLTLFDRSSGYETTDLPRREADTRAGELALDMQRGMVGRVSQHGPSVGRHARPSCDRCLRDAPYTSSGAGVDVGCGSVTTQLVYAWWTSACPRGSSASSWAS